MNTKNLLTTLVSLTALFANTVFSSEETELQQTFSRIEQYRDNQLVKIMHPLFTPRRMFGIKDVPIFEVRFNVGETRWRTGTSCPDHMLCIQGDVLSFMHSLGITSQYFFIPFITIDSLQNEQASLDKKEQEFTRLKEQFVMSDSLQAETEEITRKQLEILEKKRELIELQKKAVEDEKAQKKKIWSEFNDKLEEEGLEDTCIKLGDSDQNPSSLLRYLRAPGNPKDFPWEGFQLLGSDRKISFAIAETVTATYAIIDLTQVLAYRNLFEANKFPSQLVEKRYPKSRLIEQMAIRLLNLNCKSPKKKLLDVEFNFSSPKTFSESSDRFRETELGGKIQKYYEKDFRSRVISNKEYYCFPELLKARIFDQITLPNNPSFSFLVNNEEIKKCLHDTITKLVLRENSGEQPIMPYNYRAKFQERLAVGSELKDLVGLLRYQIITHELAPNFIHKDLLPEVKQLIMKNEFLQRHNQSLQRQNEFLRTHLSRPAVAPEPFYDVTEKAKLLDEYIERYTKPSVTEEEKEIEKKS